MSEMPPPPPPPRNQPQRNPLKGMRDQKPGSEGKPPMPKWAIWAIVGAVMVLAFGSQFVSQPTGEKLSYKEFLVQVQEGNVKDVTINNATNGTIANAIHSTAHSTIETTINNTIYSTITHTLNNTINCNINGTT
jgi:ATP-dependent Zn protease